MDMGKVRYNAREGNGNKTGQRRNYGRERRFGNEKVMAKDGRGVGVEGNGRGKIERTRGGLKKEM